MDSRASYFKAILYARRFEPLLKGVRLELPNGETTRLRVRHVQRLPVSAPFQFCDHTYTAIIEGPGLSESGCGESRFALVAVQKAIAEAYERILYRSLKGSALGTQNSNGWAAHVSRALVEHAAFTELLERDAVLVQWLAREPWLQIEPKTLPEKVRRWAETTVRQSPFPMLRFLLSWRGHVPTISTVLSNTKGMGVVSHSAGRTLDEAWPRALAETCRLARMAVQGRFEATSKFLISEEPSVPCMGPGEHGLIYAHHRPFPDWIWGEAISWSHARETWRSHLGRFRRKSISHQFVEVSRSPLVAGYCRSDEVQPLYFGRTSDAEKAGALNHRRFENFKPRGELFRELPHFVA